MLKRRAAQAVPGSDPRPPAEQGLSSDRRREIIHGGADVASAEASRMLAAAEEPVRRSETPATLASLHIYFSGKLISDVLQNQY